MALDSRSIVWIQTEPQCFRSLTRFSESNAYVLAPWTATRFPETGACVSVPWTATRLSETCEYVSAPWTAAHL